MTLHGEELTLDFVVEEPHITGECRRLVLKKRPPKNPSLAVCQLDAISLCLTSLAAIMMSIKSVRMFIGAAAANFTDSS